MKPTYPIPKITESISSQEALKLKMFPLTTCYSLNPLEQRWMKMAQRQLFPYIKQALVKVSLGFEIWREIDPTRSLNSQQASRIKL